MRRKKHVWVFRERLLQSTAYYSCRDCTWQKLVDIGHRHQRNPTKLVKDIYFAPSFGEPWKKHNPSKDLVPVCPGKR